MSNKYLFVDVLNTEEKAEQPEEVSRRPQTLAELAKMFYSDPDNQEVRKIVAALLIGGIM